MALIPKEKFIQNKLTELNKACELFLVNQDLILLEKALKSCKYASEEYEELLSKENFRLQSLKERESSTLPKDLLDRADELQSKLYKLTDSDRVLWINLYKDLLNIVNQNIDILEESETIKWIARCMAFIGNSEKVILVKLFWGYCLNHPNTTTSIKLASLIKFVINSLNQNEINDIKKDCLILDDKIKYPMDLIRTSDFLHKGKRIY